MVSLLAVTVPKSVPSTIPALSVDALIVLGVALVFLYGFIAGHAALIRESISIYVGLVLANSFGKPIYDYLIYGAGKGYPITQTEIQLILLILPIVILQFGRRHAHGQHHNMVVTVALAFAAAMLIVSSVIGQLDPLTLSRTTDASVLARTIYQLNLLWLAVVPAIVLISALFHKKSHRGHHKG